MKMTRPGYEIVEHTADWALRVRGATLAELLSNAAEGMASLLVADLEEAPDDVVRDVVVTAYDAESLLVEWLSELAYWAESEQLVFPQATVTHVTPTELKATVTGGRATEMHKHIKAVTYHNLAIRETADGLEATIVFDV